MKKLYYPDGTEVTDPEALAHPEAYGIDPNSANGKNPLDTLSFDVNTLIPHKEMNWDVIEGIDDIHNSIMRGYSNVASGLVNEIGKIEKKVELIDKPIKESLNRQTDRVGEGITSIDTKIVNTIEGKLIPLCDKYGYCQQGFAWWLFWREGQDGKWYPYLEWGGGGPQGKEYYGPFYSWYPLLIDRRRFDSIVTIHDIDNPRSNQTTQNMLTNLYNDSLANLGVTPNQNGEVTIPGVDNGSYGPVIDITNFVINGGSTIGSNLVNTDIQNDNSSNLQNGAQNINEVNSLTISDIITQNPLTDNPQSTYSSESLPLSVPLPILGQQTLNNDDNASVQLPQPNNELNSIVSNPLYNDIPSLAIGATNNGRNEVESPNTNPDNSTRANTMDGTLLPVASTLEQCCSSLQEIARAANQALGMGDLEYLYSEEGEKRIRKVLDDNGMSQYEDMMPSTVGQSIERVMALVKREGV
jgi:hypothetical protein